MNFDLISTVELAGCAVLMISTLAMVFGRRFVDRALIAAGLTMWLAGVLWMGASGALSAGSPVGTPGLGAAVAIPLGVICLLAFGTAEGRRRIEDAPLFPMVFVHALRVLGVSFVLLYAAHRLPAPFAPTAGWGDIAIGLAALPICYAMARGAERLKAPLLLWNVLGMADLVAALALGALSAPGPIRMLWGAPGSAIMTTLPWILIPCFLVPSYLFLHVAVFSKLRKGVEAEGSIDQRVVQKRPVMEGSEVVVRRSI